MPGTHEQSQAHTSPSPSTGRSPHPPPEEASTKRVPRKSLQKALQAAQDNEREQAGRIEVLTEEVNELRELVGKRKHESKSHGSDSSESKDSSEEEDDLAKRRKYHDANDNLRNMALHAGKAFTIQFSLWPEAGLLKHLRKNLDELKELDISTARSTAEKEAIQLAGILPESLYPHVHSGWFKERFQEGCRSIRSTQVHNLAKMSAEIFDINSKDFYPKEKRASRDEVRKLLDGDHFLYDRDHQTGDSDGQVAGHLRHPCILRCLQHLLNGPSAARTGATHSKARKSNRKLWGFTEATHPMLACGATMALFALSGAPEFSEESGEWNFFDFYKTRINILDKHSTRRRKAQRASYRDTMSYFNQALFPDTHPDKTRKPRFNAEEASMLAALSNDEGSEEEEEEEEEEEDDHDDPTPSAGASLTRPRPSTYPTDQPPANPGPPPANTPQ